MLIDFKNVHATETMSIIQNIYHSFMKECIEICCFKTFWIIIFAGRTFLPIRCFSIYGKMGVLLRCPSGIIHRA